MTKTLTSFLTFIIGLALGAIIFMPTQDARVFHPCKTEDSNNCYWDASTQGNGTGESFFTFNHKSYYP